ncbi:unnamed protein product [Knipowitschia caucasica]|uniref:Transforming acidic coiled-coil-containing protein C-terminal domain-containing protein n=1 Tax=Knipowitschia caucasica TaxID=637954 RepID=A0AAV2M5K6_KNICA
MSWLSPASWAKWTWTAVTGEEATGGAEEASGGAEEEAGGAEEEIGGAEKQRCEDDSDSDGPYDTPEASSPVHVAPAGGDITEVTDVEERLVISAPSQDQSLVFSLDKSPELPEGLPMNLTLPEGPPMVPNLPDDPPTDSPPMDLTHHEGPTMDLILPEGPPMIPHQSEGPPMELNLPEDQHSLEMKVEELCEATNVELHSKAQDSIVKSLQSTQDLTQSANALSAAVFDQTIPITTTTPPNLKLAPLIVQILPEECPDDDNQSEIPVPKASYKFDPENLDESFDPFLSGGSKIPNSPPCRVDLDQTLVTSAKKKRDSATNTISKVEHVEELVGEEATEEAADASEIHNSPFCKSGSNKCGMFEARVESSVGGGSERPDAKSAQQKHGAKNTMRNVTKADPDGNVYLEDVPNPKTEAYMFDPERLDESLNPFEMGGSKVPNSPTAFCASSANPKLEENQDIHLTNNTTMGFQLKDKKMAELQSQKCEVLTETLDQNVMEILQNFDDIPITKSGSYKFDPENFDESFNPFESGGSKVPNSPLCERQTNVNLGKDLKQEPFEFDETSQTKSPPSKLTPTKTKSVKPKQHIPEMTSDLEASSSMPLNFDDIPIPKTGAYNFDPENVDESSDPFSCGGSKIPNSPPPSETVSSEAKAVMLELGLNEKPVAKPPLKKCGPRKTASKVKIEKELAEIPQETPTSPTNIDDVPIPKKGSYNFDPKNFDETSDPFPSGGSKIPNSPPLSGTVSSEAKAVMLEIELDKKTVAKPPLKKLGPRKTASKVKKEKVEPVEIPQETPTSPTNIDDVPIPKKGSYNFDPKNFDETSDPFSSGSSKIPNSPLPSGTVSSEGKAVMLEMGLDEKPVAKPPLKKLGPRKIASKVKKDKVEPVEIFQETPTSPTNMDDVPIPKKGSYNFDPENFDDCSDPFQSGGSKIPNSPKDPMGLVFEFEESLEKEPKPPQKLEARKTSSKGKRLKGEEERPEAVARDPSEHRRYTPTSTEETLETLTADVTKHQTDEEKLASSCERRSPEGGESPEEKSKAGEEDTSSIHQEEKISCRTHKEKEPKHSEENLEKYLKTTGTTETTETTGTKGTKETTEITGTTEHRSSPGSDPETQSEMEKATVLTLIREEILCKELEVQEWKRRYEESREEANDMRKIVAEYEQTVAQMIDSEQSVFPAPFSVAQLTLQRDQALADLSSVERSFSELFRRYENMKQVLEGFKKNEEVLKSCAQEYLQRIRQEELRYQTLKIHAEEKLHKANEEIALVRSKAAAESVALSASVRMEQMKAASLERALEQKNQEIEELTKICDELIAKMGPA